jgi:hypothetical protein
MRYIIEKFERWACKTYLPSSNTFIHAEPKKRQTHSHPSKPLPVRQYPAGIITDSPLHIQVGGQKKGKKVKCDGIKPSSSSIHDNIMAVLGIEPRLKRVSIELISQIHNVTCYHYTTPPCLYLANDFAGISLINYTKMYIHNHVITSLSRPLDGLRMILVLHILSGQ